MSFGSIPVSPCAWGTVMGNYLNQPPQGMEGAGSWENGGGEDLRGGMGLSGECTDSYT